MIAPGEVRAADRPLKEHIPDHGEVCLGGHKDHVPGGVPGTVANQERFLAQGDLIPIFKPARGLKGLGLQAVASPLVRQGVDQELIVGMGANDGQPSRAASSAVAPA